MLVDRRAIRDPGPFAGKPRVALQLCLTHEVDQARENPIVGAGDGDPTIVFGWVMVVRRRERRARAHAFTYGASDGISDRQAVKDAEDAFIERDVDNLTAARRRAFAVGDEHAEGDEESAHIVGDRRRTGICGRTIGEAAEIGQSPKASAIRPNPGRSMFGPSCP